MTHCFLFFEIQDSIAQFAHIQNKELVGYNDLPQSVISAVSANFKAQHKLSFSAIALDDGSSRQTLILDHLRFGCRRGFDQSDHDSYYCQKLKSGIHIGKEHWMKSIEQ